MVFGLIRKTFSAGAFTLFGVYLAQNYKLPDVGATAAALVSVTAASGLLLAYSLFSQL